MQIYLHGLEFDFILLLSQEVLELVPTGLEEVHPCPEVATQKSLVVLDPDLGITHRQVIIVVHEWSAFFLFIEAVESVLVQVKQKGS